MTDNSTSPDLEDLGDLDDETNDMLLRADFAYFTSTAFVELRQGRSLVWAEYLDLICSRLADIVSGKIKRLIVTVPPRSLKTHCVSVALPAYVLGLNPHWEVMCVSYGRDLAREIAQQCQQLMALPFYRQAFGDILPPGRQSPELLATTEGGKRRATSIEGVATGLGADLLIFDDPQKPGEALSDTIRTATNRALEETFLSRANKASELRVVIVMQRLHEDDFVGHALELDKSWVVLNLPAIAEEDEAIPYETPYGPRVFRRARGEPLNPEYVSLADLEATRLSSGEAVFATQYQQRPAPPGGAVVKIAWFKRYAEEDLPERFDRKIQSWDTAYTSSKTSDFSCCTTWGVKGRKAYLLHVYRARLEFSELRKQVLEQARIHDATTVLIEKKASGISLIQDLRVAGYGMVQGVEVKLPKEVRMTNQTVMIENGLVYVPNEAPWLQEYLYELSTFPKSRYDDQVDSTSQALEHLSAYNNWFGHYELARQDAEALKEPSEEIWRVKAPPGMGMILDIEGNKHFPYPDGLFHLPRSAAVWLINGVGWELVR